MSGLIQYLTWGVNRRPVVDESDARAAAPQFQGRDGGRVLAADYRYIHLEVGVGIDVIVVDLAEGFAGNVHQVRQVVVAGGDDELAGFDCARAAEAVLGVDGKGPVGARHPLTRRYWRTSSL